MKEPIEEKELIDSEPIKESRTKRRERERIAKTVDQQLHLYTNKYFAFIAANRTDIEKQTAELLRLNASWRAWVNKHSKQFNVQELAPRFIKEIDRLLGHYNSLTEEQRKEIEK